MADDNEFITKLISFGLSEKETQLYLNLLKYGPKPTSLLAKSLKTYREDTYRTLTNLINRGMVNPSVETPTVYTAIELDIVLDAALKKRESDLREMEVKKHELVELSQQQQFMPSDEFATFKIIKSLKEFIGFVASSVAASVEEIVEVCPAVWFPIAYTHTFEEHKKFIDRGGELKVITDISYEYIEPVQEGLDVGADVRQLTGYRGIIFAVFDKKISMPAINADINRTSLLDKAVSVLWTDDPTHAQYLLSTFKWLWERSIPATQRIEELLKEGPP